MKKYYFLILALVTIISSCVKKETRFADGWSSVTYGPDFEPLFIPLEPAEQVFYVDNNNGDNLTTASDMNVLIEPETFVNIDGTAVNSVITIKIKEFDNNRDLLTGNIATCLAANGHVLTSRKAFVIDATDPDGKKLRARYPISIFIREANTPASGLHVYSGAIVMPSGINTVADPNRLSWLKDTASVRLAPFPGYSFHIYSTGYWGLMRDDYALGSTMEVALPSGYGNTNTTVTIFLPEGGMLRLTPDLEKTKFIAGNYLLPVDKDLKMLVMCNIGERLGYYFNTFRLPANGQITITEIKPATAREMTDFINANLR